MKKIIVLLLVALLSIFCITGSFGSMQVLADPIVIEDGETPPPLPPLP